MLRREHKVSNISSEAIFAIPAMKPARVIGAIIFCLILTCNNLILDVDECLLKTANKCHDDAVCINTRLERPNLGD